MLLNQFKVFCINLNAQHVNGMTQIDLTVHTVFENHSKCLISSFNFWHFPPIFIQLKVTCLVTLFDYKLQVLKTRQN